jgi:creatinine amidohydrolase
MIFAEMTAPELREIAPHAVALLPIGAIEQHGAHLATSTDCAIATAIAERAAGVLPAQVVLCPSLPFGASHHHSAYGAMSFSVETFTRVLVELVESLLEIGFRRIVILNAHGGNIVPASQALAVLSERHDEALQANIALTSYWELASENFSGQAPMESSAVRHACEYETSLMLHLHPECVHLDRVQTARLPIENQYINWLGDVPYRGVVMAKKFHLLTNTGAVGYPERATAAKGEHLFEAAVSAAVAFLKDFAGWPILQDLREAKNND